MSIPANLAYAREILSLNFEAIKNPLSRYLLITERSVFMQGIRNRPSFEGCQTVAQKWRCLIEPLQDHRSP